MRWQRIRIGGRMLPMKSKGLITGVMIGGF
jgi:hypothetical protein